MIYFLKMQIFVLNVKIIIAYQMDYVRNNVIYKIVQYNNLKTIILFNVENNVVIL